MSVLGFLFNLIGVHIFTIEQQSMLFTKSLIPDPNTFLWVELPAIIGAMVGIVAELHRRPVLGWLMIASGVIVAYPNLLVISSMMTFFGGFLYVVTGIIVLTKKM